MYFRCFFLRFYYLFLKRGEREGEREGEKQQCVVASHLPPPLGFWPTTQACAPAGNGTSYPLVHRPMLNPLSHTSRDDLLHVLKGLQEGDWVQGRVSEDNWKGQRGWRRTIYAKARRGRELGTMVTATDQAWLEGCSHMDKGLEKWATGT